MEPPSTATATGKRALCGRCQRPLRACYCAALPARPLYTRRTRVVVLQHAREQRQRQAISSVPVLAQVLATPTSVIVVPLEMETTTSSTTGVTDALCAVLREQLDRVVLADVVESVLVLFPHAEAQTLRAELAVGATLGNDPREDDQEEDTEDNKTVVLVVVDGTWHEAKKIVHHSRAYWESVARDRRARGKVFEYVCLDTTDAAGGHDDSTGGSLPQGSIYGELRKEPMEGCVSTLEAVAMALRVLEPESHVIGEALLSAFRAMVAIQSQFQQRGKAAQQARHGGTPKPTGNGARRPEEVPRELPREVVSSSSRGVARPYVFYTTHTDFRKRQKLVMEGEILECTRDEALALCSEMNRTRTRGNRVSTLPEDAFRRQQSLRERADAGDDE